MRNLQTELVLQPKSQLSFSLGFRSLLPQKSVIKDYRANLKSEYSFFLNQELGFTLTPFGGNAEDFDFALWGPDVACDSLGDPLRCSYADDGCDFCPQTGMGMGETDESENPFGNGFVSTIIVQPGQGYYLMVDNFNGTSNDFNLEWTGEAGDDLACNAPPCSVEIELGDAITQCTGERDIDLTVMIIGNGDPYDITWTGTNGGTAFLDDASAISPTATIPDDFDGEIVYSVVVISADGECVVQMSTRVIVHPVGNLLNLQRSVVTHIPNFADTS